MPTPPPFANASHDPAIQPPHHAWYPQRALTHGVTHIMNYSSSAANCCKHGQCKHLTIMLTSTGESKSKMNRGNIKCGRLSSSSSSPPLGTHFSSPAQKYFCFGYEIEWSMDVSVSALMLIVSTTIIKFNRHPNQYSSSIFTLDLSLEKKQSTHPYSTLSSLIYLEQLECADIATKTPERVFCFCW